MKFKECLNEGNTIELESQYHTKMFKKDMEKLIKKYNIQGAKYRDAGEITFVNIKKFPKDKLDNFKKDAKKFVDDLETYT